MLMISSMSATYFRLQFMICFTVMWLLTTLFIVLTSVLHSYSASTDEHEYIFICALIVLGNMIFSYQAYNREYFIRKGFIAGNSLVTRTCFPDLPH